MDALRAEQLPVAPMRLPVAPVDAADVNVGSVTERETNVEDAFKTDSSEHTVQHTVHTDTVTQNATPNQPGSPRLPRWVTFALFAVIAVSVAIAVFAYTTRCPCTSPKHKAVRDLAAPPLQTQHASADADVAHAKTDGDVQSLQSSTFVLSWIGAQTPNEATRVHFLLASQPYSAYSCTAGGMFGVHGRVRVTLPKGEYVLRAVFGDGTQSVLHDVPAHALVSLSETSLSAQAVEGPLSAADVPDGVCAKEK